MTEPTSPDGLDRSIENAWEQFRRDLTRHLDAAVEGDFLAVESRYADAGRRGTPPAVHLLRVPTGDIVASVSCTVFLYPESPTAQATDDALHSIGWHHDGIRTEDDSLASFVVVEPDANHLAHLTVTTARQVWGVPHPSFLRQWTDRTRQRPPTSVDESAGDEYPPPPTPLQRLRMQAYSLLAGHPNTLPSSAVQDPIRLCDNGVRIHLRFGSEGDLMTLIVNLVTGIADRDEAHRQAARMTVRWPYVTVVALGDTLIAFIDVVAAPFAPLHFESMLEAITAAVETIDPALATVVGGRWCAAEPEPTPQSLTQRDFTTSAELATLLTLCSRARRVAEPDRVFDACGIDRGQLRELRREAQLHLERYRRWVQCWTWRFFPRVAGVCDLHARSWELVVQSLDGAIDRAPVATPRRAAVAQIALFDDPREPALFDIP